MSSSVEIVLQGRDESASKMFQNLVLTSQTASDRLGKDFETLGIRSTVALNSQRAAAQQAFERIKNSGVSSYDEIGRASAALTIKMAELDREQTGKNLKSNLSAATAESRNLTVGVDMISSAMNTLGVTISGAGLLALGNNLRTARIEMDAINNSMGAAAGSQALAADELAYVSQRSDYLGLSLRTTARDYTQMLAAAKETVLEGEGTRKIFEGITVAATALHLSQERVHLIMTALNQMMNKGTVMAEELKGQLGESLPGAYQMAAKAMGLTTAELSKQMEQGKIMASDLLPKLAEEMEKRFGKQIPDAIKSTQAELNRLDNALFQLKLSMADSGLFANLAKGATSIAEEGQTAIMWMGQAKAYWTGMTEKAQAWVDAGGLLGQLTGGAGARADLQAQFKAIDDMVQYSWDKWNERGGVKQPLVDSTLNDAKQRQALDAAVAREKEEAAKAQAEADKNRLKELEAYKNHQTALTTLSKAQSELELATQKSAYDQGLLSTRQYYEQQKQIRVAAGQEAIQNAADYLMKEQAALEAIRQSKGDKSTEYIDELGKSEKAIEALQQAALSTGKIVAEEEGNLVNVLRQRGVEYQKLTIQALDAAGEYKAAAEAQAELDKQDINYLRLKAEALIDEKGAVEALAAVDKARAAAVVAALNKENEERRSAAETTAQLRAEVDKLTGADQELLTAEANLRDGRSKMAALQDKINLAWVQGNATAISALTQQIKLQDQLNQRLQTEASYLEQVKVLTGEIVGFNGSSPIYADNSGMFNNGQAVTAWRSPSAVQSAANNTGTAGTVVTYNLGSLITDINAPFMGGRASGGSVQPYATYRVNEDGTEYLTMGDKGGYITPADKTLAKNVTTISFGDIRIELPNISKLNAAQADEFARAAVPKIKEYLARAL